ncbi:hypothetical protein [Pseudomonas sp.]|uniref:hypothetical protein n=1 Tax=Pseudomonas sp. TaxID=306 RepID=UPI002582FBED|nr:hypothetical protein [Pseudomonas sp.]
MQVEQIDRDAAQALWEECFGTTFYHEETEGSPHIAAKFKEAFARHRRQARAEVVGEVVAWLREEAVIYRSAWAESVDPRASVVADAIEAKFGGRDV